MVTSPRFIGRRSASAVLSQDCLGLPVDSWAHDAGLESSVMILPEVGAVEMYKEGQTAIVVSV